MKQIILFVLAISLPAVALDTVEYVDLNQYAGTWYEIARYPFSQQEGCFNSTANYALNPDGTIKVTNRCRKGGFNGPESVAIAKAKVDDFKTNAKLKVKFFWLAPWADYWIIQLGQHYEYAVVSQPSMRYLWVLSRTPQIDEKLYADILSQLKATGFDIEKLTLTPQKWEEL